MGHVGNWSDRKLASYASAERAKGQFGWWRAGPNDKWAEVDSPFGLRARAARLCARCSSHDCSRRVRLDPEFWIARSMGDTRLSIIKAAYLCARTPCGLAWQNEIYPNGLPLIAHVDRSGARVGIACNACRWARSYPARAFVEGLIAAGRGEMMNAPAWRLDGLVRGRCAHCGENRWAVRLTVPGDEIKRPPGAAEG